jgi:hypothetical protein
MEVGFGAYREGRRVVTPGERWKVLVDVGSGRDVWRWEERVRLIFVMFRQI